MPLASGSRGLADVHLRAQHAAERLAVARSARGAGPATGRSRLRRPRPASSGTAPSWLDSSCHQPGDTGPRRSARGSASPPRPPRVARSPSSAPAAASRSGSARTRPGARCRREPEVALRQLARPHRWCVRPGPAADRPAAARATRSLQHRDRARPSRSAPRSPSPASSGSPAAAPGSAAPPHPPSTPPAARTYLGGPSRGQRLPHRVPRDTQRPGDHLDRHPLSPVQPPDLSPVLHGQHSTSSCLAAEVRVSEGVSFRPAAKGSVFTCRRHRAFSPCHVPSAWLVRTSPSTPSSATAIDRAARQGGDASEAAVASRGSPRPRV